MKTTSWLTLLVLAVPLALAGCAGTRTEKPKDGKQYEVQGQVVAVAPDKQSVTLDHEEIPGLMKAMKMEFRVADAQVLEGIQAGDRIHGHLRVEAGRQVITHLEKH